ncbi:hypothetical protein [Lysobacter sp. Root96]|uniref:hypothetical protein n=1 Tax=Lysobacter sp. Root96 TaxID=1736612 RepID=UPI0007010301|nr:hypothetical protein [Lysobacter sp. Root96]KRD71411.1 hypothetical protein ASE45_06265 [Lysobacter sp. Root96]
MTAFYITQRVRKVRGNRNVGATGTVAEFDPRDPIGATLGVRHDMAMGCVDVFFQEIGQMAAGTLVWGSPDDYEPILPAGLEDPERVASLYELPTDEVTA